VRVTDHLPDLKMEKVRNFLRNYLESEKFFSKFSYFLGEAKPKSENFQGNLKSDVKVKNFFTKFLNLKLKLKVIGKRNFH